MRIPALLVRHGFAIAASRAARFSPGLKKLVGVPLAILRYPGGNEVGSLPEDKPHGRLFETDDNVLIRPENAVDGPSFARISKLHKMRRTGLLPVVPRA